MHEAPPPRLRFPPGQFQTLRPRRRTSFSSDQPSCLWTSTLDLVRGCTVPFDWRSASRSPSIPLIQLVAGRGLSWDVDDQGVPFPVLHQRLLVKVSQQELLVVLN